MMMPINFSESSSVAKEARAAGNNFYCERSFFNALVNYNKSLCYAKEGSEDAGLAYSNRSAVFFEMGLYEKTLQNIKKAKDNGYPEHNYHILDKRAEKCKTGSDVYKEETSYDFVKLSYEPNPKLPFVARCLELKSSVKFGRYIITNQDLRVGDIVAIEESHFKIIKSDERYETCQELNKYQRCSHCLKDNLMDLIPCSGCESTMFCSENCAKLAYRMYHKYECPIIDRLHKSGIMQMALRVFFQALSIFDGSIEELENFLKEIEKDPSASVYDFDFSDKADEASKSKSFLTSLYCLTRSHNVCPTDKPDKLLNDHPLLKEIWKSNEVFIRKFIGRILQIGDSNFHGICGWSIRKYENQFPSMVGIGCYPFISLCNSSCAPNVNRIYIEGKMFLMVERPIKKGEQLFDCYRTTFFTQSKKERQYDLLENYSFNCECEACINDYPLFSNLKTIDKKISRWAKKGKDELSKLDGKQARKKFKEYCETIQKHHAKAFPSTEIVLLQECILYCMSIVIKPKVLFP